MAARRTQDTETAGGVLVALLADGSEESLGEPVLDDLTQSADACVWELRLRGKRVERVVLRTAKGEDEISFDRSLLDWDVVRVWQRGEPASEELPAECLEPELFGCVLTRDGEGAWEPQGVFHREFAEVRARVDEFTRGGREVMFFESYRDDGRLILWRYRTSEAASPPPIGPYGARLASDHPAEVVLRECADWGAAKELVRNDLLLSPETAPSEEAKLASELLSTLFYSAAAMDEDARRVRKWLNEPGQRTMSELAGIARWQRNNEAAVALRQFEGQEQRLLEEVARVAQSYLRRSINPLAQAVAPAIFTPEGVRRTRELLRRRIFGQDDAIDAVVGRLEIAAAGLADPDKPLGSFLFLGPTGVGKTEVARVLAESLPDGASALAVFDMGQYKHPGDLTKLVGWTIGGQDSKQDGAMVDHVQEHPYSVLVFDEIEKAHEAVYDVFLGALDNARVQDQYGKNVSLADAIFVFTSNVSGDRLHDVFRREFLNRIDETIEFEPLTREVVIRVFDKLFGESQEKLERRRGIRLEITPEARDHLIALSHAEDRRQAAAYVGFGPASRSEATPLELGARPLGRVLEREVERRLAAAINHGEAGPGDDVVIAVDESGALVLTKKTRSDELH